MFHCPVHVFALVATAILIASGQTTEAQQPQDFAASTANVPRLITFNGLLHDRNGLPITGVVGVTFSLYKEQQGGASLWSENQNVQADGQGRYVALLGLNQTDGLPKELFTSGEPKWLGVQAQVPGEEEQPRVYLVSVPYALKAADADTIGGKPVSAFMLAPTDGKGADSVQGLKTGSDSGAASNPPVVSNLTLPAEDLTIGGNIKFLNDQTERFIFGSANGGAIRLRSNSAAATDRLLQLGHTDNVGNWLGAALTAAENNYIGIGTTTPQAPLEVSLAGSGGPGLLFSVLAPGNTPFMSFKTGDATNQSYSMRWLGGSNGRFQIGLGDYTGFNEHMSILANGNVGIGTPAPAAKLDVAGDLKVGGNIINGSGSLSLPNTAQNGTSGVLTLGGAPFLHNFGTNNTFVGQGAGNFTMTGNRNTATGFQALQSNTTGSGNTAGGYNTLALNTTGNNNTASGSEALFSNTTGSNNTAMGQGALPNNTADNNTAVGNAALNGNTGGTNNTATGNLALRYNTIGNLNTASGVQALNFNTTGSGNTADGAAALENNTTGFRNTATGRFALQLNTTGIRNTALGFQAGYTSDSANANVSGSDNIFIGFNSGPGANGTTTPLNNATAIGTNAVVSQSNSLVLGSINGINGATSDVNVGIGTATPAHKLDVVTNSTADGAAGLQGAATASTGRTYGVYGYTNSTADVAAGVQGVANGSDGRTFGVFGYTNSTKAGAAGVSGTANASTGQVWGVVGSTNSHTDLASGVVGAANDSTGVTWGVYGGTNSTTDGAAGTFGHANATTGKVYGIIGQTESAAGAAGLFYNTAGGNILVGQANANFVTVFRVDGSGKGFFNGGTQTGGADFAEAVTPLAPKDSYEPGDVLAVSRQKSRAVELVAEPYSTRVAGIYSTKPGVLATPRSMDDPTTQQEIPLAIVGIVPCKVTSENGPIQRGDLLVASSRAGYAMRGTDRSRMLGAIVGKALEPLPEGAGVIEVLVTLQ